MHVGGRRLTLSVDDFLDYFIPVEIRVRPDSHRRARMFMLSHVFGPFLGNVIPLYLFIVGVEQDYRFWIFTASITAFWLYPFLLKYTRRYNLLAFASIQNLLFRSEEHTSELQSLMRISYAVFCLKKKKHNTVIQKHNT